MKNIEYVVLGLAGIAAWLIVRQVQKAPVAAAKPAVRTEEIFGAGGGNFTNGWRYFTDGTAIDPAGAYYRDGLQVWAP
jgi:hypothetical protein